MKTHFGDPCIHCRTAHDDVPVGTCVGDSRLAVDIAYFPLYVRWDGVDVSLVLRSDNTLIEQYLHSYAISHYRNMRMDINLIGRAMEAGQLLPEIRVRAYREHMLRESERAAPAQEKTNG